jgi:hypothetical protein
VILSSSATSFASFPFKNNDNTSFWRDVNIMGSIKPEKELEQEVRAWCFQNNIWVNVFDSKAKYTERGVYKAQGLPVGTLDLIGLNSYGKFVGIELKAPNKPAIPSLEQRNFAVEIINKNGFAAVVNDLNKLINVYTTWLRINDDENRRKYLIQMIGTKAYVKTKGSAKLVNLG